MKFRFENLGPIKEADLELGDLTIIAGRNNTGKTYIAYALYGFLNGFDRMFSSNWGNNYVKDHFTRIGSGSIEEATRRLRDEGQVLWDMSKELLKQERDLLVVEMAKEYSRSRISHTFNASPEHFRGASLSVDHGDGLIVSLLGVSHRAYLGQRGRSIVWDHDEGKVAVSLTDYPPVERESVSPRQLKRVFLRTYLHFLLGGVFAYMESPYIFSSSRHSIPLFIRELDYVRNQVVLSMQHQKHESNVQPPIDYGPLQNTSSYPLPVHDNIDFFRRIPRLAESHGNDVPGDSAGPIEDMLRGRFDVQDDLLRFKSIAGKGPDFDIPLHLASSSSWELSGLHFFLKYIFEVDYSCFIIIDEPESHLDTANQIQFTRLLARLVNSGVRILITTHSDYIIREVNNLIMLSSPLEDESGARDKFGYHSSDQLSLDQVKAYVAEECGLTPCRKDKYGIEITSLDEVIDKLNEASEELASQIMMKDAE